MSHSQYKVAQLRSAMCLVCSGQVEGRKWKCCNDHRLIVLPQQCDVELIAVITTFFVGVHVLLFLCAMHCQIDHFYPGPPLTQGIMGWLTGRTLNSKHRIMMCLQKDAAAQGCRLLYSTTTTYNDNILPTELNDTPHLCCFKITDTIMLHVHVDGSRGL